MTDRRITPIAEEIAFHKPAQIIDSHADLLRRPSGPRDRQLLYGDTVVELNRTNGWSYLQADRDGYCGYVRASALGPAQNATHKVASRASHIYQDCTIKSPEQMTLTFASRLTAIAETPDFIETTQGFVPRQHVQPVSSFASDPASVAALYSGSPYLWGGNTQSGIDCSGLVQAALLACNLPCPGDSDQQLAAVGTPLPKGTAFQRNDLLFWTGHVALVWDETTLIHANAGHMATTFEPITDAIARIKANGDGDGDVIAHKRL